MSLRGVEAERSAAGLSGATASAGWVFRFVLLGLGAAALALPFAYAISTVLKPAAEALSVPIHWLPSRFLWANFLLPFQQTNYGRYFFNSFLVGVSVVILNLITVPWPDTASASCATRAVIFSSWWSWPRS